MRKPMRLNSVEAFVVKDRFDEAARCRVTINGGDDIGTEGFAKHTPILKRVVIGLAYHVGRHIGVIQALADAMGNRGLERVVMKDVFVDEGGELGLATRNVFRFVADTHPDRIDLVEALCRPRLKLSHEPGSPDASRTPTSVFLAQIRRCKEGVATRPAHGSCALVKEVNNACFVDFVTYGKHMVAVRDIESSRARNERSKGLCRSCHHVFGADSNQNWRVNCT